MELSSFRSTHEVVEGNVDLAGVLYQSRFFHSLLQRTPRSLVSFLHVLLSNSDRAHPRYGPRYRR